MTRFSRHLWQRFASLAVPYWFSEDKWRARGLLVLLALLLLGQSATNVLFNEESGEFTSALAAKDAARFWRSLVSAHRVMTAFRSSFIGRRMRRNCTLTIWSRGKNSLASPPQKITPR